MRHTLVLLFGLCLTTLTPTGLAAQAEGEEDEDGGRPELDASLVSGLELRGLGPALTSGRICGPKLRTAQSGPGSPQRRFPLAVSGRGEGPGLQRTCVVSMPSPGTLSVQRPMRRPAGTTQVSCGESARHSL